MKYFDAFISHAGEDKEGLVREIAELLDRAGHRIWFDEFTLTVGDGLRRSIDKGIAESRFGIVVLSKAFFAKEWTHYELDGLNIVNIDNPGIILPLWHGVTRSDVLSYSPSLANIVAIQTEGMSVKEIASRLAEKLGVYRYYANRNRSIKRSRKKYALPPETREQGFQVIYSNQSFRIINEREAQAYSEIALAPLSIKLNEYPLHYWQTMKGDIQLVRHVAYDVRSGDVIKSENAVRVLDENRLLAILRFKLVSVGPIKVIGEITTTQRFNGLFEDGLEYEEFTVKRAISLFSYSLIMPDTKEFEQIEMYANETKLEPKRAAGEILFTHSVKNISVKHKLKYTIINRAMEKTPRSNHPKPDG